MSSTIHLRKLHIDESEKMLLWHEDMESLFIYERYSLIWRLRIDDADVLLLLNEPLAHNH